MLLLYDEDELSASPDEAERALAVELGAEGLRKIDASIVGSLKALGPGRWKVARVIADALHAGGFSYSDPNLDAVVNLHARRVQELVASGAFKYKGRPFEQAPFL
jgi:hypothetical protein